MAILHITVRLGNKFGLRPTFPSGTASEGCRPAAGEARRKSEKSNKDEFYLYAVAWFLHVQTPLSYPLSREATSRSRILGHICAWQKALMDGAKQGRVRGVVWEDMQSGVGPQGVR